MQFVVKKNSIINNTLNLNLNDTLEIQKFGTVLSLSYPLLTVKITDHCRVFLGSRCLTFLTGCVGEIIQLSPVGFAVIFLFKKPTNLNSFECLLSKSVYLEPLMGAFRKLTIN